MASSKKRTGNEPNMVRKDSTKFVKRDARTGRFLDSRKPVSHFVVESSVGGRTKRFKRQIPPAEVEESSTAPTILEITGPEHEAKLQDAIAADPDTWEAPPQATVRRRGRPTGSAKTRVTMMVDNDVLEQLKGDNPKGWQTRANLALRKAVLK